VDFPIVFGCLQHDVFELQKGPVGTDGSPFEAGITIKGNEGETGTKPGGGPAHGTISGGDAETKVELAFYSDLTAMAAGTPGKQAADMLDKLATYAGEGFACSQDEPQPCSLKCFAANYRQEFKPKLSKQMRLAFTLTTSGPIAGKDVFGIVGFYEAGATDVNDATIALTGFQNARLTMGVAIDEEVDAKGVSWWPATTGKTVQRYRVNTAVANSAWTAGGTPGVATLQATTDDPKTLSTTYTLYMDTFVRRRTTIRNKSITATINELGAAFAAAMILTTWFFTDVEFVEGEPWSVDTAKVFRFKGKEAAQEELKVAKYTAKEGAEGEVN